ncbi:MAG: hypothetical protein KTR19_08630 [Hyphomicrobiales bacterium]|nr:hypothetical protein [Hyphomicrobiales bacterium]
MNTEAMAEAVLEQLDPQAYHRVRSRLVSRRRATINKIRSLPHRAWYRQSTRRPYITQFAFHACLKSASLRLVGATRWLEMIFHDLDKAFVKDLVNARKAYLERIDEPEVA